MEKTTTKTKTEIITDQENAAPSQIIPATDAEREQIAPEVIYQNNIYALVDDMKTDPQFDGLTDQELKQDKAFFPRLINYIYNNYIGELLGNKYGRQVLYKNIQLLDDIFNIYIDLVYKYKWNNRPLIIEFSIFTGINRDTFYNWLNGVDNNINISINNNIIDDKENNNNNSISGNNGNYKGISTGGYLTRERSDIVRKWIETCERGLIDGQDTIKDIFILKAKYNYREASNDINITVNHKNIISADNLPALLDLQSGEK